MTNKLFNTDFENSLRLVILLDLFDMPQSLDMLYAVDFITVYGVPFGITRTNLNGNNPFMFSEFASRREVVRNALRTLVRHDMVLPVNMDQGIFYIITPSGEDFSASLESAYPNCTAARMSIDTADAIVNGKKKKYEGKGYRAFLNTIVLFSLMKVLEEHAVYALRMLVVDSPILSLKEKKLKLEESEKATPGMRESLFRCILANCGANQMIIAENEIPENVDYSSANVIEFTMDDEVGRYGFLRTRKVLKDAQ